MFYKLPKPTAEELAKASAEFTKNNLTKNQSDALQKKIRKGEILTDPSLFTE